MIVDKVRSVSQLAEELKDKPAGLKVVFTNGCFDILNQSHVRYLEDARQLGNTLVVAVNGDESVRKLKGPPRPYSPWTARAQVVAALESVSYVVPLDETRISAMLKELKPDIWAKGGDYTLETLDKEEVEASREAGVVINILPLRHGPSTTDFVKLVQTLNPIRLLPLVEKSANEEIANHLTNMLCAGSAADESTAATSAVLILSGLQHYLDTGTSEATKKLWVPSTMAAKFRREFGDLAPRRMKFKVDRSESQEDRNYCEAALKLLLEGKV